MTDEQRELVLGVIAALDQLNRELKGARESDDYPLRDQLRQAMTHLHQLVSLYNGSLAP